MDIDCAILGLLSLRPLSGYDLKKLFGDLNGYYWSGNNNQIYKSLLQLHQDGLVSQEVQYQASLPARKIYTLTEKGRAALRQWLLSSPELPEFRSAFLVQLTWADLLTASELDALLANYEDEVRAMLLMQQEKARREAGPSARTEREAFLWKMVSQHVIATYQNEMDWVRQVRGGLNSLGLPEGEKHEGPTSL